jgi:hypothetical protein
MYFQENQNKLRKKERDVESSSNEDFCDSFHDFSDDASNISINEFGPLRRLLGEEQEAAMADAFLEIDIPFKSGKWILVAFATKKTKKHYVGVITSMNEGHPTVKFARRVKSTSAFTWPQTDDISEIGIEDVSAFLPEPVEGR